MTDDHDIPGGEETTTSVTEPVTGTDLLSLPRWGLLAAFGLTVLMIATTIAGGMVSATVLSLDVSAQVQAVVTGLSLSLPYLIAILVIALVSRSKGLTLAEGVALRPAPFWSVLVLSLGVAFGARMVAAAWGLLLQAFGIDLPGSNIDPTTLLPSTPLGIAFTILGACVLAPIAEEMVFRGVLLSAIAERWGTTSGIVVSSAAFAAVHIYPYAMVPIFVLALVLARLFLRSRTLWVPIAAHALFNTIGVLAVYALKLAGRL